MVAVLDFLAEEMIDGSATEKKIGLPLGKALKM